MTTTEPKKLYATLKSRGAFEDPLVDGALDDLISIVGTAICRLTLGLDDALHPEDVAGFDDAVGDDVHVIFATLDRAVSVYARLLPLVRARQRAVEGHGVGWDHHLEQIDAWKEALKRRAA